MSLPSVLCTRTLGSPSRLINSLINCCHACALAGFLPQLCYTAFTDTEFCLLVFCSLTLAHKSPLWPLNSPSGFTITNNWAKFIVSSISPVEIRILKLETIWKALRKETFLTFSPRCLILLSVSFQSYPQWNLKLTFGRGRCISSIHKPLLLSVSCKDFWEFFLVWELCMHTSNFRY